MIQQLIDMGVTKRSLDTLISRGITPIRITADVTVCCGHGREKRAVRELETMNPAREKPHICPCCENIYTRRDDTPGLPCPACNPNQKAER